MAAKYSATVLYRRSGGSRECKYDVASRYNGRVCMYVWERDAEVGLVRWVVAPVWYHRRWINFVYKTGTRRSLFY